MKKLNLLLIVTLFFISQSYSQDSTRVEAVKWNVYGKQVKDAVNSSLYFLNAVGDSVRLIISPGDSTLSGVRFIDFDLEDGWAQQEGRMGWNDDDKTLEIGLEMGSILQIGQELYIRGVNKTGGTIHNGRPIYISGAQGNRPAFAIASNTSLATSMTTIGLATHDIADNQNGYVTVAGLVRDIPDSLFVTEDAIVVGEIVWLCDEKLADKRQPAPTTTYAFGVVTRVQGGVIDVLLNPVLGQRLAWLPDVNARGNQTNWDMLRWNTDSARWDLTDGLLNLPNLDTYADNAAAITGGLSAGDVYRTSTGDLKVVY